MASAGRPAGQNKMELYERRRKALELKHAGYTYDRIGQQLGITRQVAHEDVRIMMREYAETTATEVRDQETARLDRLITTYWPKAIAGDIDAAHFCLRVMDRRAKLLGLDAPQKVNVESYIVEMAMREGLDPNQALEDARAIVERAGF